MKIESTVLTGQNFKPEVSAAETVERRRKESDQSTAKQPDTAQIKVAPEEILSQIKDLTEDGQFSVRFEMNKTIDDLVIQVVNRESGELIRQIPADELITTAKRLNDYRGLIIKTES